MNNLKYKYNKKIANWIIYKDGRIGIEVGCRICTKNPIKEKIDIRNLDDKNIADLFRHPQEREIKKVKDEIVIKDLKTKKIISKIKTGSSANKEEATT